MKKVTYVGMDVHLNSIAVVWGSAKEKLHKAVVPNTQEGMEGLVRAIGTNDVWGMYEASSCGFEVYDRLTGLGWKMSIVAPTHIPKSAHGRMSTLGDRRVTGMYSQSSGSNGVLMRNVPFRLRRPAPVAEPACSATVARRPVPTPPNGGGGLKVMQLR